MLFSDYFALFLMSMYFYTLHSLFSLVIYVYLYLCLFQANDTFSYRNIQEAMFMVLFCRHLVLQGYEPDKITVLTTYAAQMFYIRNVSSYNIMIKRKPGKMNNQINEK